MEIIKHEFNGTGILLVKDFLDKETLEKCKKEINERKTEMELEDRGNVAKYIRFYEYTNPNSELVKALDKYLYSDKLKTEVDEYNDLAWRQYVSDVCTEFEVQVTSYRTDMSYMWHVDHNSAHNNAIKRSHNFILYLTSEGETFEGGHLQVSKKLARSLDSEDTYDFPVWLDIKPKENLLAFMPSYFVHRVTPVKMLKKVESIWETRLSINGHLGTR